MGKNVIQFNLNPEKVPEEKISDDIHNYFFKQTRSIEEILIWATEHDASDIYIKVFEKPYMSRYGKVTRLPCTEITKDMWATFYDIYVLNELNAKYVRQKTLDLSVELRIPIESPNFGKFETNYYRYRAAFGFSEDRNTATFRMIRPNKPTFDTINYPKQCEEILRKAYEKTTGIIFFSGPTGSGKALHIDTKIPTPNGFTTMADLKVGDVIYSEDATNTVVMEKYCPESKQFFEITFSNGQKIKAADNHLWKVHYGNQERVLETEILYRTYKVYGFYVSKWKIEDIQEIEGKKEDYYCISVDHPSHMFLCTESYIPTHNSTTMAACINTFTQPDDILDNTVIITLEDPIENEFSSTSTVNITQKELERDFKSFPLGLKNALREHPNMIIVGECRDKEVITTVTNSSMTGHNVVTTVHSSNCSGTLSRLLFYLDNDLTLTYDLLVNTNLIMSQRLIKNDDRYIVDTQYLYFNDYVTKTLLHAVQEGKNVALVVENLIADENLQEQKIVKDWDYLKH